MSEIILATKFHIPRTRPSLVPRPRLFQVLERAVQGNKKLVLLSAPAGSGKSTILVDWLASSQRKAAWISLGAGDNDLLLFFQYLILALGQVFPGIGKGILEALKQPQPAQMDILIAELLNELSLNKTSVDKSSRIDGASPLILEDYHFITTPEIHEFVAFLLENLPSSLEMIIATRSDPPFPLSRLRASGQMVELRASELRFDTQEARALLQSAGCQTLTENDLDLLNTRTEGWAAGLQMAALSIQDRPDATGFIRSFSGSHRFILDYLLEEVLNRQPQPTQSFLLNVSVLDRFCAEVCNALMGSENSRDILDGLERANLFLVPLDEERKWYRFHHLFHDLLQSRLVQIDPQRLSGLHQRAADWFEMAGLVPEAVDHALAIKDFKRATRLVEQNTVRLFQMGELHTLLRWIKYLPESEARQRPWLLIYQAWTFCFAGNLDRMDALLQQYQELAAHRELAAYRELLAEKTAMDGNLLAMRAYAAFTRGDIPRGIDLAGQALEALPVEALWPRSVAEWVTGYSYRIIGDLPQAMKAYQSVIELAKQMDNTWTLMTAMTDAAMLLRVFGKTWEARHLYEESFRIAEEKGVHRLGYMSRVDSGYASILCDQNELDKALELAELSIPYTKQWHNPNNLVYGHLVMARILQAKGEMEKGRASLEAANEALRAEPVIPVLYAMLDSLRITFWLAKVRSNAGTVQAQGEVAHLFEGMASLAAQWIGPDHPPRPMDESSEIRLVAYSQGLLAVGRLAEAGKLLAVLEESARKVGRVRSLTDILLLQAARARQAGDLPFAREKLVAALRLAEPEGCIRGFADLAGGTREVLSDLFMAGEWAGNPFISQVLALLASPVSLASLSAGMENSQKAPSLPVSKMSQFRQANQGLIEPLSEREIEVLKLMAQGLTNQEIARILIVSPGTVKAHSANIYRKLDVANRTQAVTRAQELKILSLQ